MMEVNQMWEVIDLVIKENVETNEAIRSYGDCSVQISYSRIESNQLKTSYADLEKRTLCYMSIPTLRLFIKEIINTLRGKADVM